jgi:hypothetical protein
VSERPLVSGHPRHSAGRRGTGATGDAGEGDQGEQTGLAEQVAERVYQLLQEELRLERERGSRRRGGRWER